MKSIISTVALVATIVVVAWLGHIRVTSLENHNRDLTVRLNEVSGLLKAEVERSQRVEAATVRLEKGNDERQARLRMFERQLAEVARNSAEAQALLRTIVPDDFLGGLRSFPKRPHDRVQSEQGSGIYAGTN